MTEIKPDWVKIKTEELEKLIIDISKDEKNPSKIGIILRDKHGIPKSKLIGLKIQKVLAKHKIEFDSRKGKVDEKITKLKAHIEKNSHDNSAKRSLEKELWIAKKLE